MDSKDIAKELTKDMPRHKEHGQYQMCLGSLIKALQRERVGLLVVVSSVYQGYADKYPGIPHSYHGYPADLAFTPDTTPITVAQFLAVCETAIQSSFVGPDHAEDYYRDYIMQPNTPVWISELDKASKLGITDVVPVAGHIELVVESIEEEEDVPKQT